MTDPALLPVVTVAQSPDHLSPELAQRLEECVFRPVRSAGEEASFIGVSPPPARPVYPLRAPDGAWWLVAPLGTDPVIEERGGLCAPDRERARIRRLRRAGLRADRVAIGHEMGRTWSPGQPLPRVYESGALADVARTVALQEKVLRLGGRMVRFLVGAARQAADAATVAGTAATAVIAVDPIVLVAVDDPRGDLVGWVELMRWGEDQDVE